MFDHLVAARGQRLDQLLATSIEKLAQIARTGRQCSLERLTALPERAFEFAKAARQGHANFVDPLGEALADLPDHLARVAGRVAGVVDTHARARDPLHERAHPSALRPRRAPCRASSCPTVPRR